MGEKMKPEKETFVSLAFWFNYKIRTDLFNKWIRKNRGKNHLNSRDFDLFVYETGINALEKELK